MSYLKFEKRADAYRVLNRSGLFLGLISLDSSWSCYVFCPESNMKFSFACLLEIANFIGGLC